MRPFMLYHWSPLRNRAGILKRGLCPRKRCLLVNWRAPYICFARFPTVAWALSATHYGKRCHWDLWCCWSDIAPYKTINGNGNWWTTEYRISRRIPKSKLWHVGTKLWTPRKKRNRRAGSEGKA